MPLVAPLLMALAEFFISRRPAKAIAEQSGVDLQSLSAELPKLMNHTWRGKLAAALSNPAERPDLIPLYIHLARLEEQHAFLVAQLDRAQDLASKIRSQEIINLDSVIKAEAFTFKVQTAIGRLLKDIERAEIRLEKAQKPAAEKQMASGGRKSTEFPTSASEGRESPEDNSPSNSHNNPAAPTNTEISPVLAASHQPSATNTSPPDPLLTAVLARHRQRIKTTQPKDRPALIARLLEQERTKPEKQAA